VQAGIQQVLLFALAAVLVSSIIANAFPGQKAFADGLTSETFTATLGGRNAELLVKVNPPVLTDATREDAYMLFRLYDANNNQTVKYTTLFISVEKGVGDDAVSVMPPTLFHTESGLLRLKVQPAEGDLQIFGTQEQFLNAWVADPGGTINIRGPIFLEGGIYHFRIEIFGVDNIRNIFADADIPKFDSWLSVGDVFTKQVQYNGQAYDTTIISYYDQVGDFNFDAQDQTFIWSMPFDWNVSRLEQTSVYVHEEVRIPKSMAGVGDATSFAATVNDKPISGRMLVIDPFTSETELTLHYLLNKNDIVSMASNVPDNASQMMFTLAPSTEANMQTSGEMSTDTGGINVAAEWTPSQLNADTESTLKLDFSDAFSGGRLDADVIYDLRILDSEGNEVYSQSDLTAEDGTSTQTIDFPNNENYRIEIVVKGLVRDGQPVDTTRNGIARGIVVVPEFPTGAIVAAVAGVLGVVLLLQRFARKSMPSGVGVGVHHQ
jgi:hypothetical protein